MKVYINIYILKMKVILTFDDGDSFKLRPNLRHLKVSEPEAFVNPLDCSAQ